MKLGCWLLPLAGGIGAVLGVGTAAYSYLQFGIPGRVDQPEPQVDVRSVVVQQLTGASELATARLTMELVVPISSDRVFVGRNIGTTNLLYIARGYALAGIDLSQSHVTATDGQVTVTLPPPSILDANLDLAKSETFSYDRGVLGLGPDNAPELQALAQQEAVQRLRATACAEGLLTEANARAENVVQGLLAPLGQPVVVQATEPEECN